jgi:hypothetical protein
MDMTKIELVRSKNGSYEKRRQAAQGRAFPAARGAEEESDRQARDLTQDEENEVVYKEIKEAHETLDTTPASRPDITGRNAGAHRRIRRVCAHAD